MTKWVTIVLAFTLVGCTSSNEDDLFLTGTVSHTTSCGGIPEPMYIIKLSDNDSIMSSNLPDAFQIPNLKIRFKTKTPLAIAYCTDDKIYPEQFDVYDVTVILE